MEYKQGSSEHSQWQWNTTNRLLMDYHWSCWWLGLNIIPVSIALYIDTWTCDLVSWHVDIRVFHFRQFFLEQTAHYTSLFLIWAKYPPKHGIRLRSDGLPWRRFCQKKSCRFHFSWNIISLHAHSRLFMDKAYVCNITLHEKHIFHWKKLQFSPRMTIKTCFWTIGCVFDTHKSHGEDKLLETKIITMFSFEIELIWSSKHAKSP